MSFALKYAEVVKIKLYARKIDENAYSLCSGIFFFRSFFLQGKQNTEIVLDNFNYTGK